MLQNAIRDGAALRQVMALARISCSRVVRELKPPPAAALDAAGAEPGSKALLFAFPVNLRSDAVASDFSHLCMNLSELL